MIMPAVSELSKTKGPAGRLALVGPWEPAAGAGAVPEPSSIKNPMPLVTRLLVSR